MKKTNEAELVEKFRKLESELVEVLKIEGISFDDETKKQTVKSQLKAYIARKVFDEYEKVAKEIEKIAAAEGSKGSTSAEISEEVVALREDEIEPADATYVDKIEVFDGKTKIVKKKKTTSTKEF